MTRSSRIQIAAAATLLAASTLIALPQAAEAMPIAKYDQMSRDDRARYLTILVSRAVDYLEEHGQNTAARKVMNAFDGKDSTVYDQLYEYLETGRSLTRGTGRSVEVEHAMLATLHELGVEIPKKDFMTIAADFVPRDALRPPK